MITGVSLQRTAVFQEGDVVMRRPPPFRVPGDAAPYDETGLIIKANPVKKHGVGGAQTMYDAQDIEILWGTSGDIEDRTTVFNNLLLVNPVTGLPESVFIGGGWDVRHED